MRAGVDVGGTFTDFVAFRSGQFVTSKVPSRPREPDAAVVAGMRALGADSIAHGTTVATNAIVEPRGERVPPLLNVRGVEPPHFLPCLTATPLVAPAVAPPLPVA